MSKLAVASLTGLGGIGGGLGIYKLYTSSKTEKPILPKTIADKLAEEKFSILGTRAEDEQHGTSIKAAYETSKSDPTKVFSSNTDELKDLCRAALTKPETDPDYQKAKRGCVTPVTITNHLSNLGLKVLNTSDTTDQSTGTNKVTEYEKQENANKRISDLTALNEPNKGEQLRNKCQTISEKKSYEDSFFEFLDKSILWCSVEKTG